MHNCLVGKELKIAYHSLTEVLSKKVVIADGIENVMGTNNKQILRRGIEAEYE